jgi:hypothetical protein
MTLLSRRMKSQKLKVQGYKKKRFALFKMNIVVHSGTGDNVFPSV